MRKIAYKVDSSEQKVNLAPKRNHPSNQVKKREDQGQSKQQVAFEGPLDPRCRCALPAVLFEAISYGTGTEWDARISFYRERYSTGTARAGFNACGVPMARASGCGTGYHLCITGINFDMRHHEDACIRVHYTSHKFHHIVFTGKATEPLQRRGEAHKAHKSYADTARG